MTSKIKEKKLKNKTVEEVEQDTQEKEKEENEIYKENNLNNIKMKYIPFIHKNSNIKILENLDNNNEVDDDDDKLLKIEKVNYIGRNDFNTNNSQINRFNGKYPFLLSRITKNYKTNKNPSLTQEVYLTKFNSTFNLNAQNNYGAKQIKSNKPKIENNISNNKNINLKKNKKDNNEQNTVLKLNNKKKKSC